MKQNTHINIVKDGHQLHYMVELNDMITQVNTTEGFYNYSTHPGYIQFFRNSNVINNFDGSEIHNVCENVNTWYIDDKFHQNYCIPRYIDQREMVIYIPRYSVESFFTNNFNNDGINPLSGIRYVVSAYVYIAGIKVVLGSYLFDLRSALAPSHKVVYKNEDYKLMVKFNIIDPVALTYADMWKMFRVNKCGELPYTNNAGSVLHVELEPVIPSTDGDYYIKAGDFEKGVVGLPFEKDVDDYMHAHLDLDDGATIQISFNDVYKDKDDKGDINLYLAETYGMWKMNEDGEYVDSDGNVIERNPHTGIVDEKKLVPRNNRIIFELVIRDKDNVYNVYTDMRSGICRFTFDKSIIQQTWGDYRDGLIMQGCVEIYDTEMNDINDIREECFPVVAMLTNTIPLTKDIYKLLIPVVLSGSGFIKIDYVDMYDYNVSVVNKIQKKIVNVNRPADYKSNIIKPIFYSSEPSDNLIIHPEVSENIGINLNRYKSKVDIFFLKLEGVEFIEIGRNTKDVIFNVDGNQLPNKKETGIYYILNQDKVLVTSGKYTYEQ